MKPDKILFLAAHVDDCEISCGATITKLKEQGHHITVISLSHNYAGTSLHKEFEASMKVLNVDEYSWDYFETRHFPRDRQQILDKLYLLRNDFNTVFCHDPHENHQDHQVTGQEAIRAFKNHNLFTYASPFNSLNLNENHFQEVSHRHLMKKIEAIQCYKSQSHRTYMNKLLIFGQARTRGLQAGYKFAEAFRVIKLIHPL
jgi:LmbE family N-acetylglucosaminyl deacetylase